MFGSPASARRSSPRIAGPPEYAPEPLVDKRLGVIVGERCAAIRQKRGRNAALPRSKQAAADPDAPGPSPL